jgi:hypothetical protein
MKFFTKLFGLFLIGAVSASFLPAAPVAQFAPVPLDDLIAMASAIVAGVIGIPIVVSACLSALEYFDKISAAGADNIQIYINTGLYFFALVAVLTGKTDLIFTLDNYFTAFSPILLAILSVLTGGVVSVVQTKRYTEYLRSLYPMQYQLMVNRRNAANK